MVRISKSWGRGVMAVLTMLAVAGLLNGCGGGGDDDCQITAGRPDVVYTPSITVSDTYATDALTYRLNQPTSWTLQPRGMTQACLKGLKVRLENPDHPLPAGFKLDAATGTIDAGVMTRHVEGRCLRGGNVNDAGPNSVNRLCPAGYTVGDERYVLMVTSDHYNIGASPIPLALVFRPAE
ncbi:hypothetical protein ACQ86G_17760 [Roseateles chitinivorans]|uniref:hypothetical protein n=1 Tax=Roseateles chitinivorans TaxID=2917965 RepID=UPI003D674672